MKTLDSKRCVTKRESKMGDHQIAEHVGVDHKTVASVRQELETTGEIPQLGHREGINGKSYAVKTAKAEDIESVVPKREKNFFEKLSHF
jgi:hypothetical protein